jgi:hypothetical protein
MPTSAQEALWKARIRELVPELSLGSAEGIVLRFVVTSWKRRGHPFDLDNLAKPVLDALGRPNAHFVEATIQLGTDPGVSIGTTSKPSVLLAPLVWFPDLPRGSLRWPDVNPALLAVEPFGGISPLRVHLDVHEPAALTDFDFTGFVKPTLDCLWPVIGGTSKQPYDHLIRHIIVTWSTARSSGVSVGIARLVPIEAQQVQMD